jgi:hypothetical protein
MGTLPDKIAPTILKADVHDAIALVYAAWESHTL